MNDIKNDYAKKAKESAELGAKLADKRKKRNDAYTKLQKAQQDIQKKQEKIDASIRQAYEEKIAELQLRIVDSLSPQNVTPDNDDNTSVEEYDVFISHAYEDKASFVDEFVNELENCGTKCWDFL